MIDAGGSKREFMQAGFTRQPCTTGQQAADNFGVLVGQWSAVQRLAGRSACRSGYIDSVFDHYPRAIPPQIQSFYNDRHFSYAFLKRREMALYRHQNMEYQLIFSINKCFLSLPSFNTEVVTAMDTQLRIRHTLPLQ